MSAGMAASDPLPGTRRTSSRIRASGQRHGCQIRLAASWWLRTPRCTRRMPPASVPGWALRLWCHRSWARAFVPVY